MGKYLQNLTELSTQDTAIFVFWTITSKCQGILTKHGTCIDIKEMWFWIANGQIMSVFERVIMPAT